MLADLDRDAAAAAIPGGTADTQARAIAINMRDETSIDAAVEATVVAFGRIDCVLNSAGVLLVDSAATLSVEAFRASVDINLTGAFLLTRAAAKAMSAGGRIVHIVSASSIVANAGYAAYASSKAGQSHMIRVLARELAEEGITVNGIGPAVTETPMTRDQTKDETWREGALSLIPMGRFGTPEDLLGTVILLMSEAGGFITGQTLYVDGGRTLV